MNPADQAAETPPPAYRGLFHWPPFWFFVLLVVAASSIGYVAFQQYKADTRRQEMLLLSTIVDLKVEGITKWRAERKGDAEALAQGPFFSREVEKWLQRGAPPGESRTLILERMQLVHRAYDYREIFLFDVRGKVVLATSPDVPAPGPATLETVKEAIRAGSATFMDIGSRDEIGSMGVVAPVLVIHDGRAKVIGAIYLRIDPSRFLFPLLKAIPLTSKSMELVLVRREGNDVLFLNVPAGSAGAGLLRQPLSKSKLPAAMAVSGMQGEAEGVDYRGVPVFAALREVPGSGWFLVAKVEQEESYAPLRRQARIVAAEIILLVTLTGIAVALWRRNQRARFLIAGQQQTEKDLRARSAYARSLIEASRDPLVTISADGKITDVNEATVKATGVSRETLVGSDFSDYFTEPARARAGYQEVFAKGFVTDYPLSLRHASGKVMEVLYNASVYRNEKGEVAGVFAAARDITERRRNEAVNASRLHLVQFSQTHTLDELLEETLNECERLTGSLIGFYHFVEEDQNSLTLQNWSTRTKAEFCKAEGKGLHYPIDEAGVWADCVRQGKPVIHNDYAALPNRKGMPEGHAAVIRELVVPVRRGDRLSAILGVGNKPDDYTESDVETVLLIADLTGEIAARKRAEDALRKASTLLNATQRLSKIGGWEFDVGTGRSIWTEELYRLHETPADVHIDHVAESLKCYRPEDRPKIANAFKCAAEKGEAYDLEFPFTTFKGQALWIRTTGQPVYENGKIVRVIGNLMDITERKLAEESIREAHARFSTIFDQAPLGIALIDSHTGKIHEVNPRFAEIAGRTIAQMQTIDWMSITHPDDVQEDLDNMALMNAGKIPGFRMEKRYLHLDGSFVWINMTIAPLRGEQDISPRHLCMIEDITERKRAEEQLRAAASYTRSLIEASLDPLVTISVEGKISDVNEAGVRATGVSREELVGSDFSDYFTEPDRARAGYQEVFAKGFVKDYPLALRHASGSVMEVLYNASVYRNEKGEVAGVFAAARDVTRARQAERLVRERVKELQAFFYLSELAARTDYPLDSLCQELVNILPQSWQYPEITCARIVIRENEFRTANFRISEWMQAAPVNALGTIVGKVEVGYIEQKPEEDEGPFLEEERQLIDAIAERVGQITELKHAETALRSSEELFRALASATSEGMLIHEHGRIIEVNRQMEGVLGRPRAEIVGGAIVDFVAPAWRDMASRRVQSPEDSRVELAFVRPDGSEVVVSGLAHPCVYLGRPMRVAVYRDITLEKRAEEALRNVGTYNRSLIEVSLDPLVTISPDGKITDVNEATIQATGLPRSLLIGSDFSNYFTEPDKAREGYEEVFAKGFVADYPLCLRHVSGRIRDVLYNASVYRNAKGEIAGVFAAARDVTERKKLERELERQAHIDLLTDLNNRRQFMELAEQELARSRRHGKALSLLMMDLDNFKRVNDTYGHDVGDSALRKLSEVCRHTFREIDIVGRIGGEEFAALLPETTPDRAVEVAERLRQGVEGAAVKLDDGSLIHFTVSIGVAGFGAEDEKIGAVLKRADAALYKAKNSGRNRVCSEGAGGNIKSE